MPSNTSIVARAGPPCETQSTVWNIDVITAITPADTAASRIDALTSARSTKC
jgi:hypothetical protein